jgi:hypothetical protein
MIGFSGDGFKVEDFCGKFIDLGSLGKALLFFLKDFNFEFIDKFEVFLMHEFIRVYLSGNFLLFELDFLLVLQNAVIVGLLEMGLDFLKLCVPFLLVVLF